MSDELKAFERLATGVHGLDEILNGGLIVGGTYLVMGRPGSGKTILANQIAYSHVAGGGRALYVTLLAESHAWLISTLQEMSFFREEALGGALQYISGYQALEKEKLDGLTRLLRKIVRDHRASLLVIDGLVTAGAMADTELELKKFIHELQSLIELVGCTTLLLTGAKGSDANYPERTMVDGLFQLTTKRIGMRTVRELEIEKHRGSSHVLGASFFEISSDGIRIFGRTEAMVGAALVQQATDTSKLATGISSLDSMLSGGLPSGSTAMLLGSSGSGKTLLGLHFLNAGAHLGERALYFGFFEAPSRLVAKAKSVDLDLAAAIDDGRIEMQWRAPQELLADRAAEELLTTVRRRSIKRVFIDGLDGFRSCVIYPERTGPFFTALSNELRSIGATTLASEETLGLYGCPEKDISLNGVSSMMDTIILLRYVELRTQLHRFISIMKMREGRYDTSLREFQIDESGFHIAESSESARAILADDHRTRDSELGPTMQGTAPAHRRGSR
ncbi:RAD55 family ATPase [Pendulispora albinea]|uniref:non-specific serine/threonine protein kinase n=1 Tax=Pendulispora albinea TaxID=2741071 RepID=A0ABZ2LP01_9BACT